MTVKKSDYINYRFKRSEESFEEALIMIENKKWNAAVSRLYYSGYYAVIALLLKSNIEARSHSGVRNDQICTPIAPAPNKNCTLMAKSTPYPPSDSEALAKETLHRDNFLAKEKGRWPVLASGNATSPYCRAVSRYGCQSDTL